MNDASLSGTHELDRDDSDLFESLLEEFLIAYGEGRKVDLDELAAQLPDAEERARFKLVAKVEVYLNSLRKGEAVVLGDVLAGVNNLQRQEALRYLNKSRDAGSLRPRALPLNTLLAGRFRIKQQLASGGTATVYRVHDEEFDVERILKACNPERATTRLASEWEQLALGEARVLARLESRNIVTVHDIVRDGPNSYIVMDLLRGCDMHTLIGAMKRKRDELGAGQPARLQTCWFQAELESAPYGEYKSILDPSDWYRSTARIACLMLQALELAHGESICHHDIKPANVFIVPGGEPVLLDFGVSSGPSLPTNMEDRLIGTPQYMAPEQFRERRAGLDPRTDIYQCGVLLYELVTLQCPFDREAVDLVQDKCKGRFTAPHSIDPHMPLALAAIIQQAMRTELDKRYATAHEMRVDLERFAAGKPPLHAPLDKRSKARMWARWTVRKPVFLVGLVGAIALAGILAMALRGERWIPPSLHAKYYTGDGLVRDWTSKQSILWRGVPIDLGLAIDATRPSLLYAFELYGQSDETRFIRALPFEPNSAPLRVSRVESTPVLTLDGTERLPVEELFILATERPNAGVDDYISDLEDRRAKGIDVPYDPAQVRALFTTPTRGTSRADMTPEKRAGLALIFDPGSHPSDADYAKAGVKPYHFDYRIRYEEDSL